MEKYLCTNIVFVCVIDNVYEIASLLHPFPVISYGQEMYISCF